MSSNLWFLVNGSDGWSALSVALLHSLWQAGLVALVLAIILRTLPAQRASLRANLAVAAQVSTLLVFFVTCAIFHSAGRRPELVTLRQTASTAGTPPTATKPTGPIRSVVSTNGPPSERTVATRTSRSAAGESQPWVSWTQCVGVAWLFGVFVMLLRTGIDLAATRTLVRNGWPVDSPLAEQVDQLCRQLRLSLPVKATWSERLQVPAVYGVFRPVLLVPTTMAGVPPDHVESILAHELAHLRRYDWLWHLAGRVIESILFFNPCVWWIGRLARREREAAADALAVAVTKQPRVLAEALVGWSARGLRPALLPAWTGDRGSLRDRVTRLVQPTARPPVRLSPLGIATASAAVALVAVGLWGGSRTVVAVAQEILTPAERIKRVEAAGREVTRAVTDKSDEDKGDDSIRISGTVTLSDGRLLKRIGQNGYGTISVYRRTSRPNASAAGSVYAATVGLDGDFSTSVSADRDTELTIVADWEGAAPAVVGPLKYPFGDRLQDLQITLEPGFQARVELTGPDGEAVTEATIVAELDDPLGSQPRQFSTGDNGVAVIRHATEHPYRLTVTAAGYQRESFHEVRLAPDESVKLQLKPVEPTAGVVRTRQGEPIDGATISLLARSPKPNALHTYRGRQHVLAITDRSGSFVLDSLPEDQRIAVLIDAQGFGSEVREVAPGDPDMTVQLGPERILRGRVVGDLSKLERRVNGEPSISYSVRVILFEGAESFRRAMNFGNLAGVNIVEAGAGLGTFELRGLLPGEVTITAGPIKRILEPFGGVKENVVLDLDEPTAGGPPRRKAILRFAPAGPDDPPPTGDVRVDLKPTGDNAQRQHEQFRQPLENGRIEVQAFAPGTLSVLNQGLVGYWFDEDVLGTVDNYRALAVPRGDDPFTFTIPVKPAGAIRGQLTSTDGDLPEPVTGIDLQYYFAPTDSRGAEHVSAATVHPDRDGEFLITPVPLGRICKVVANLGVTKVFSAPVSLTEADPLERIKLELPKLVSASVRVVDSEGRPLPDTRVRVERSYDWFTSSTARRTDDEGRVTFEKLAADHLDRYVVTVGTADSGSWIERRLPEDLAELRLEVSENRFTPPERSAP